jgi:hypothetical protein
MRRAWLVALAGCNGVLGLRETQLADAFELPPPKCPELGTVPMFTGQLGAVPARGCTSYTISATTMQAAAACGPSPGPFVYMGPVDGSLAPVALDRPDAVDEAKLAPEGDVLFTSLIVDSNTRYVLDTYVRDTTTWRLVAEFPAAPDQIGAFPRLSAPSRGPDRRMLLYDLNNVTPLLIELADSGTGQWYRRDVYPPPPEVMGVIESLALTEDGLRAIVSTPFGSFYTDRQSISDRFVRAQPITTVPGTGYNGPSFPYLREDCGRLYFSGLGTILYIDQQ